MSLIKDRTAIVGVGTTRFGAMYRDLDPERTPYGLVVEAFQEALADCGLAKSEIDGLVCHRIPSYQRMADVLGIHRPRIVYSFEGQGRMSGVSVQTAVMAIATGQASVVACVYGNVGRSAGAKYGGETESSSTKAYDTMYGMTSPGAYVAMMYRRYQHIYGVPDGALAPVAINNRKNAALNPNAVMQTPLTHDEYMAARFIVEPLRLFDYCLINDGAVVMILTSAERARDLKKPPAYVAGIASCTHLTNFYTTTDIFEASSRTVSEKLYDESGLRPEDVDCAQIYDNFTPTVLFSLENFGYCKRGEAWEWVKGGRIERGGELPVNTAGGHTSESYMQGWALQVEAVRQVRGEAGKRQVPDCHVAHYICVSPIVTSYMLHD